MIYRIYDKRKIDGNIKLSLTTRGIEEPDAEPIIIEENAEGSIILSFENGEQFQFEEHGAVGATMQANQNLEIVVDERIAKVLGIWT